MDSYQLIASHAPSTTTSDARREKDHSATWEEYGSVYHSEYHGVLERHGRSKSQEHLSGTVNHGFVNGSP